MPALAQNDFRARRNQRVPQHLVRRQPKPLVTVEENYAARLVLAVGYVQQQINQHIMPKVGEWVEQVQARKADTLHTDIDEFEVIGQQFENIRINTQAREAPMSVATRQAAIQTATIVGVKNAANLAPILERLLGTDPFAHEPWLMPLSRDWVSENVSLIKSIGEKHLTEVEHLIYRMVRQGESIKTIRAELEARWGVTKNRARLIARDQVNKYNGQLTEERQTKAGINFYRWRNMQDRRVRGWPGGLYAKAVPSHAVMEGLLYRWDDTTVYFDERIRRWKKRTTLMEKLHPGAAIQCRCYAEPVLDNV